MNSRGCSWFQGVLMDSRGACRFKGCLWIQGGCLACAFKGEGL